MKNGFASAIVVLLFVLGLSSVGRAQMAGGQGQPSATTGRGQGQAAAAAGPMSPWKFYPKDRAVGDGGAGSEARPDGQLGWAKFWYGSAAWHKRARTDVNSAGSAVVFDEQAPRKI